MIMKKGRKDIVYSTNPNFQFQLEKDESSDTPANKSQNLRIFPDRKNRNGKTVTVISGYVGKTEDLKTLEKKLKAICGCGGTVKDGDILLQGNFIQKVSEYLTKEGYKFKVSGV